MNQQQLNFDITKNRHRGNKESIAANEVIAPFKLEQKEKVFRCVQLLGKTYLKEIAKRLDLDIQSVSARLSELKAENRIVPTGKRAERCAILRVARPGETNEVKKATCENCERLKMEIETLKRMLG